MALEIERKFLVTSSEEFKASSNASDILQVYLTTSEKMSIRVRIDGIVASLAIKSKVSHRVNREYEYNIPIDEARSIMQLNDFPINFQHSSWLARQELPVFVFLFSDELAAANK